MPTCKVMNTVTTIIKTDYLGGVADVFALLYSQQMNNEIEDVHSSNTSQYQTKEFHSPPPAFDYVDIITYLLSFPP